MKSIHLLSAVALRDAFMEGQLKATEIAEHFLKRIEHYNPQLGAFLSLFTPRVLRKAEELDRKRAHNLPLGRLAAIPVAVKDNMHIAGEITTCGSGFLKNYRAPFDATAVRLLESEDALLLGKSNLDEFAMGSSNETSAYFPTHNPWDQKRVPGGSSGGSTAAVAARLALLATGSDTGGSIRQPAAFCGVVGFKPTYGRVSRYGLVAYGSSLDQIGPIATCVADAALCMEVMGRYCPHDGTSLDLPPEAYPLSSALPEGTCIGIPKAFLEALHPEIQANFSRAIETFRSLGADIREIDLDLCKYSLAVYYILATAEASTNLARFDGVRYGVRAKEAKTLEEVYALSRKQGFGFEVKKRILLGTFVLSAGYQDAYYRKAQKVRTLILDVFEKAFEMCDAILLPTTPSAAFSHHSIHDPLEMYLQDFFTIPANLAGLPAISVPSGYDAQGLPLGIQIMGAQMCDVFVLQCAYAYEQATRHAKIPPLFETEPL